jgi:hypothetical protein
MPRLGGENFGNSVTINGNHALVGEPVGAGKAHLFDITTGSLLRTFANPAPSLTGDHFGWSVAMDGNKVLIGAPNNEPMPNDIGRAFLFDATSGSLLHTFKNPFVTSPGDLFGWSVALQGDNVLIGAPLDDSNGTNHGLVYLFDAVSGTRLNSFYGPTSQIGGRFGDAVDIDGNRVVIGHPWADNGFAKGGWSYLYDISTVRASGGGGIDTAQLLHTFADPTPAALDFFGNSIAIDGDKVVVGNNANDTLGTNVGQAHLFDAITGLLLHTLNDPTVNAQDRFGWSVDIDGNTVVVGALLDDTTAPNIGQAHLFDALTGALLQTLNDPTLTSADAFGSSVAIDSDRVLVGAWGDDTHGTNVGQAYLFSPASAVPEPAGLALLGIGLAAMAASLAQRRKPAVA